MAAKRAARILTMQMGETEPSAGYGMGRREQQSARQWRQAPLLMNESECESGRVQVCWLLKPKTE